MKIAVSGKGGVGKTTFCAYLIKALNESGYKVLAIDADPDANLASALGIELDDDMVPISEMKALIEERTETKLGTIGGIFKLNPKVDDLPDRLSIEREGIRLMVLGGIKKGGIGCVCPESTLLKNLVRHLVLDRREAVVMDMEAGLEHLGRGTAIGVDAFIVVVEPGRRSIMTAKNTKRLADDLGIKRTYIVANKIRGKEDREFIENSLKGLPILGYIPFSIQLVEADIRSVAPYELDKGILNMVKEMFQGLKDREL